MYSVLYSRQAEKSFLKLPDKKTKLRIKKAIDSLSKKPVKPGVVKLQTVVIAPYRLRIGNYRILFDINRQQKQVLIFNIRRRDERTYR